VNLNLSECICFEFTPSLKHLSTGTPSTLYTEHSKSHANQLLGHNFPVTFFI